MTVHTITLEDQIERFVIEERIATFGESAKARLPKVASVRQPRKPKVESIREHEPGVQELASQQDRIEKLLRKIVDAKNKAEAKEAARPVEYRPAIEADKWCAVTPGNN